MAKKNRGGHAGGHGWFVTFADLMGLLMSFFVMLVAFSTQDQAKLQVVAGSMRDAFGVPEASEKFQILCEDGARFLAQPPNPFDVLLIDCFTSETVPPEF